LKAFFFSKGFCKRKFSKDKMKKDKVLIIKTGYSEVLDRKGNSRLVSLGDVLRTTPLLHLHRESQVTWIADPAAFPLLEGNEAIHKLLPYDFTTALQLQAEEFDTVINLEKIPGVCALSDRVRARRSRYGFTFDSQTGEAEALDKAIDVLTVSSSPRLKKENRKTSQELLFEMVGANWKGEEYLLGYKPTTGEFYDVALNTQVGQKWPTKAWPDRNWGLLEELLGKEGLKVTRQDKQSAEVLNNLYSYMNWINSARLVVSNDSLGLHLGLALRKRVLGLFGPTPSSEVYFYGRGEAITPESDCEHLPCFRGQCATGENCMDRINSETVLNKIREYLKK
jgi:heptosyltransferase II